MISAKPSILFSYLFVNYLSILYVFIYFQIYKMRKSFLLYIYRKRFISQYFIYFYNLSYSNITLISDITMINKGAINLFEAKSI